MSGYDVGLFVHLLGVTALFGGIGLQQAAGARLRRARTLHDVRLWLGFVRPAGRVLPVAGLVLLGSGLYMTAQRWTMGTPWIGTSFVALLAMAVAGATVLRATYGAIGRTAAEGDGPVPVALAHVLLGRRLWVPLSAANGAAIGVLWLMTNKPGWAASIAVVAGSSLVGGVMGGVMGRRDGRARSRMVPGPGRTDSC